MIIRLCNAKMQERYIKYYEMTKTPVRDEQRKVIKTELYNGIDTERIFKF